MGVGKVPYYAIMMVWCGCGEGAFMIECFQQASLSVTRRQRKSEVATREGPLIWELTVSSLTVISVSREIFVYSFIIPS